MSESKRDDERLLAETFHENWETGVPAQFARTAATHARNRQRVRKALTAVASVAVLAAGFFVARDRSQSRPAVAHVRPSPVAAAAATARGYEIISDDELLAQLRDRPVLAVQNANGTREILVLQSEPRPETLE